MTDEADHALPVEAWIASTVMHAIIIALAVLLASYLKPIHEQEPFHWNVSLVDTPRGRPIGETVTSGAAPAMAHAGRHNQQPDPAALRYALPEVPTRRSQAAIQQEQPEAIATPAARARLSVHEPAPAAEAQERHPPIGPSVDPAPDSPPVQESHQMERVTEARAHSVTPMDVPHPRLEDSAHTHTEPAGPLAVEQAKPSRTDARVDVPQRTEIVAKVDRPITEFSPVETHDQVEHIPGSSASAAEEAKVGLTGGQADDTSPAPSAASSPATPSEPVSEPRAELAPAETRVVAKHSAPAPQFAEPTASTTPGSAQERMADLARKPVSPPVMTDPVLPAAKAVQPMSAARPDYRWLIESIGRRLAELKRYPATARLHGWEGRVVLRAIIRADGNLADVKIQKSSGYDELDMAAMDVLRQACPLSMRQALGRPEIVVNIPVVYALAQ